MFSRKSVFPWVVSSGLVCALVLGGLNPVQGQERVQTKQRTRSNVSQEVRRLSMLIGGGVRIAKGVTVGKIEDVVINDRGCIEYVIVVYHDKYVPIPWTVTTVDFSQRIVTVDITEERFAVVPTFTRDDFSVFTKTEFTEKVHSTFGGKGETKPSKAGGKAESPQEETKVTKSEPKPEPPKAAAQKKPNGQSKEEPKGESNDEPKGESKEKPKGESKDKPKR